MKTVIGTQQLDNIISIQPLSQRQVRDGVRVRTSVKTSYMVRSAQNTLEAYRYIDCGANSTLHHNSGGQTGINHKMAFLASHVL
ncbi:hypothetical protein Baya_14371 [Bagarius yarrelli]|uniref:Transmembrane protein 106 C-terminal domain-containing protein n=1 Tax=Bagarius yarrelli TaxID=175774 RepID=A0A556V907_BAGYA|nr:hypothetical protein Baya_14371 [Bagarius yarrelli]